VVGPANGRRQEEAEKKISEFIEEYNQERLHSSFDNTPPAVFARRLLKNPRNVSEASYVDERGVRRRRCRQCIAEEDLTTLFGVTRFVSRR